MFSEIKIITPKEATLYLESNKRNRQIDLRKVSFYAKDMIDGNWTLNHQGIAFCSDGTLADGQHRLMAIVKADKPIAMMVTYGLDNDEYNIDQHKARTICNAVQITGISDLINRDIISLINYIVYPLAFHTKITVSQYVSISEVFRNAILFLNGISFPKKRGLSGIQLKTAVFKAYIFGVDRELLANFINIFSSGIYNDDTEIAPVRLRNYSLQNAKIISTTYLTRRDTELKSQYCIDAFAKKKSIGKIFTPKDDIYELDLSKVLAILK